VQWVRPDQRLDDRLDDRLDELLAGLNESQRRAVTIDSAPLCIVAGAGSGKTRVLTRRIAYRSLSGDVDARHVLAVTFTRKAARELRLRLARLGLRDEVTAGTFHAIAYAELRRQWAERGSQPLTLVESKVKLLARLLPRGRFIAPDVAGEIEWAKARVVSPSRYPEAAAAAGRRPPLGFEELADIYRRYEESKRHRRELDFDDLLWESILQLEDPDHAAALRWRFRHLFVDEFQDINPLQHRLLEAWRGDRLDLCVVGDPNQAIYGWNGADPGLLDGFATRFPGAEVVVLDVNYRSTPQVLAAANAVLRNAPWGSRAGPVRLERLQASRPDGDIPVETMHPTDRHEARALARRVLDRHGPGTPWSHQAILFRTNAQAVLFEEALKAIGVPYRVKGRAPFVDLPEVRDALRTLSSSRVGFRDTLAAIESGLGAGSDTGDTGETGESGESGGRPLTDAEEARTRNVQELLRLADEYAAAEPAPSAAGFRAWLAATLRGEEADGDRDAVELVTFHAAKGLEWPVVHLAGLEDGLVPIGHARTAAEHAEERRLFYVALTRARDELVLSWAEHRTFGTRTSPRSPSPYLEEIAPALAALRVGERPADWRENLERQRRRLDDGRAGRSGRAGRRARSAGGGTDGDDELEPADRQVFEALRQWRADAARAANVPAYVVFHDSTLRAIAVARPGSAEELLTVAGIGPVKAGRFGSDVLRVVAASSASSASSL
jgi:DNA helicase-2/ATP-dependent DNA helicase PcrA